MNDLSPVRQYDGDHGGIYYKRDDLYSPWGFLNGGKVRQAIELLRDNRELIINDHNNTVITTSSVHSMSGAIMAVAAHHEGMKCILCVGGSKPETLLKHPMMRLADSYGTEVRNVCGHGMSNAVYARMMNVVYKENYFNATYKANVSSSSSAIVDSIGRQVENIPDKLDNLVIPVGYGIHMAGIIRGLQQFGKKVNRLIGVSVGPAEARRKNIEIFLDPMRYFIPEFEVVGLKTQYSKKMDRTVFDAHNPENNFRLDPIYEAKAYDWLINNINKQESTLFWVAGVQPTEDEVNSHIVEKRIGALEELTEQAQKLNLGY